MRNETGMLHRIASTMPRLRTLTVDDYISAGRIGMLRARLSYDATRGASYATYAWACAKYEMWHMCRKELRELAVKRIRHPHRYATDDCFGLLLTGLGIRESAVLTYRYRDMYTQREVADALRLSQTTVARIEHTALDKLRKYYM